MKGKLQKQQAYKYKGKPHYKHVIIIPDEAVSALGWTGGQVLELEVNDSQLNIKAKKQEAKENE